MNHTPTPSPSPFQEQDRQSLERSLLSLLGNPHDVEDVLQEAWLEALQRPPRHDQNLKGWLFTVARFRALRAIRQGRRQREREQASAKSELIQEQDLNPKLVRLRQCVAKLPTHYREVVVLRYLEGLSLHEVSERLQRPVLTIKSQQRRGLVLLRQSMQRRRRLGIGVWLGFAKPKRQRIQRRTRASILTQRLAVFGIAVVTVLLSGFWRVESHRHKNVRSTTDRTVAAVPRPAGAAPAIVRSELTASFVATNSQGLPAAASGPSEADRAAELSGPFRLRLIHADERTVADGHLLLLQNGETRLAGTTAGDGTVVLKQLPLDSFIRGIAPSGRHSRWLQVASLIPHADQVIPLWLNRAQVIVPLTIIDETGVPVPEVQVRAIGPNPRAFANPDGVWAGSWLPPNVHSDQSGVARIQWHHAAPMTIELTKAGYSTRQLRLPAQSKPRSVRLFHDSVLRRLETQAGNPVPHAECRITAGEFNLQSQADADGWLALPAIPDQPGSLTIVGWDQHTPVGLTYSWRSLDELMSQQLVLIEGSVLAGFAKNAHGKPIPEHPVFVHHDGMNVTPYPTQALLPFTETDTQGRFLLPEDPSLISCEVVLSNLEQTLALASTTITAGSPPLTLQAMPGLPGSVSGTLPASGSTSARGLICITGNNLLQPKMTAADAAGAFTVPNLQPGSYRLWVQLPAQLPQWIQSFELKSKQHCDLGLIRPNPMGRARLLPHAAETPMLQGVTHPIKIWECEQSRPFALLPRGEWVHTPELPPGEYLVHWRRNGRAVQSSLIIRPGQCTDIVSPNFE